MIDLFKHQKECVDFIIERGGSGAILHEMGLGKTRTAIEIFRRLRESDAHLKMLVIAPISLLNSAWGDDVQRFGDGLKYCNLRDDDSVIGGSGQVVIDDDILAINYEALLHRFGKIFEVVKKSSYHWICVLDESSKIKNHASQITKLLLAKAPIFKYRLICTGTPAPNSEMEYWPQMQFVKPGSLGNHMTAFRSHFFHLRNRYTGAVFAGRPMSKSQAAEIFRKCEYSITPEKREELMRMILPMCHLAKKKDCLDLPDQLDEIREIELGHDQRKIYDDMEKKLVAEIKGQQFAGEIALKKLLLLREITSGFIYNNEKKGVDIFNENKKHS